MSAYQERAAQLLAKAELNAGDIREAEQLAAEALAEYEDGKRQANAQRRLRAAAGSAAAGGGGGAVSANPTITRSLAREFTHSESYRHWKAQNPGHLPETGAVAIPPAQVSSRALLGVGTKAITGGQNLVGPDFQLFPQAVTPPLPPPRLVSLVVVSPTESDLVLYPRADTYTNAAAAVPEDGSTTKPESALTYSRQQAPVTTIAHWIPATKQAVSDVGQLEGLIGNFLSAGVADALEREMLSGSGSSPDLLGILNTPGIQTQAAVSGDTAGIQAVRQAIALIQETAVTQPTAVVMSIADDAAVDLARDNQGRYFGAGPFSTGPNTLWGLPRIASYFLPQGTALVGDFRQAVLWDREQASVSVSDSHADFFTRNMVAILGEARVAFGVLRPSAFCTVAV